MITSKKRKVFSIEEKSRIIQRMNNGESNGSIAKEFGVPHSTISTIWKHREKIMYFFESKSTKLKRARTSGHKDIEEALVDWLKSQRTANAPINGALIREKAKELAQAFGKEDFKCTSSWIQRFRGRHDLSGHRIPREKPNEPSASLEEEWLPQDWLSQEWLTQGRLSDEWVGLCEGYKPDDIFNADETGLFFNVTPDKTAKFKYEQCSDGKMPKARITLMVAANMTGTCKEKLLVVGNKKLIFENDSLLPVTYESNDKSWMTPQIYLRWLRKWDNLLKLKSRKIVLLVDKSPVHPVVKNLQCIKIVYLPQNIPAVLQPMAQGIITSLKVQYRKLQLLHILQNIERGGHRGFSVFDAILMISEAWENVAQNTIADCFHYAGFKDLSVISNPFQDDNVRATPLAKSSPTPESSGVHPDNMILIALIQSFGLTLKMTQIEEFVEVDNNLTVCVTPPEETGPNENLRQLFTVQKASEQEKVTLPSLNEALGAATILKKLLMYKDEFKNDSNLEIITQLRRKLLGAYTNYQSNKVNRPPQELNMSP